MVGVDQVLTKLATVIDPDLKKDIVSMGMIKDLELNDGNLKFTLELTTPACPFNDQIEQDVRNAIQEISEIKKFDLNVTAKVMEGRALDAAEAMSTVKKHNRRRKRKRRGWEIHRLAKPCTCTCRVWCQSRPA